MSHTKIVLGCMKFDRPYRQDEIAAMTGLSIDDVARVCKMLEKGMMISGCEDNKMLKQRQKKFKSNQRALFN